MIVQSLNYFPVNSKWALESPQNVISRAMNKIVVLRDKMGNYIFVDSVQSKITHFSAYDFRGINLIRSGSFPIDKTTVIEMLKREWDCIEE